MTPERKLIYELAGNILELQYRCEALASLLRTKLKVTPEELKAAVDSARAAREADLKASGQSPEKSLLDALARFEGPKQ